VCFGLDRSCEELSNDTAQAREHGVPFELSNLVERIYRRALSRYGPIDGELLAVALLEEKVETRLRSTPQDVGRARREASPRGRSNAEGAASTDQPPTRDR
jgi:hypothetical protein